MLRQNIQFLREYAKRLVVEGDERLTSLEGVKDSLMKEVREASRIYNSPYATKRAGCNSRRASNATLSARIYSCALSAKWLSLVVVFSSSNLI